MDLGLRNVALSIRVNLHQEFFQTVDTEMAALSSKR